jgi:hypothetical protein
MGRHRGVVWRSWLAEAPLLGDQRVSVGRAMAAVLVVLAPAGPPDQWAVDVRTKTGMARPVLAWYSA